MLLWLDSRLSSCSPTVSTVVSKNLEIRVFCLPYIYADSFFFTLMKLEVKILRCNPKNHSTKKPLFAHLLLELLVLQLGFWCLISLTHFQFPN